MNFNSRRYQPSALLACCLLFGLSSPCVAGTAEAAKEAFSIVRREAHPSPDRSLIANVVFLKQRIYGDPPSRIEIRRADGRLLHSKDYSSYRGQGYTVRKAGWTADGRFFVYIVNSSGGHGPWHSPVFFYSRKRHRFYNLDAALDATLTGDMQLRRPCTVLTKGRYFGKSKKGLRVNIESGDTSGEKILAIDLARLEPHLEASAEDSRGY